ncbi:MAG: outer membrane beta-barrel protein [Chitinophagaceae bacterium]
MKKIILIILILLSYRGLNAKQKFGLDLNIGVKAGLNANKVLGKGWKDAYKTNPHAGFFIYLNKRKIGLHGEVIFSQNKMITDSSFYGLYHQYYNNIADSVNAGNLFRFTTVSIPILLNIKLLPSVWIQLGPQYSSHISVLDKNNLIKRSRQKIIRSQNSMIFSYWFVASVWQ